MYRLIRFGTLSFEYYNQVDDIGSGVTPTSYLPLPDGGALDNFGDRTLHPGVVERSKSMRLRVATETELTALYLQFLSLRGKRDKLYRRTATGDIHWMYARLVEVTAQRSHEQTKFKLLQDITLRFATQDAFWHGDYGGTWYFDSGEYFDSGLAFDSAQEYPLTSSPTSITVSVGASGDAGRAASRAIQMEIHAGDSAMSAITIARAGGESLTFGGTIAANKSLVIDCGTMQVLNDGVDAYDDLTLSPTADMAAWFTLQPGDNEITVTFTGGGTGRQIDFLYYEVWY
jgi:hypothetical protein